MRCVLVLFCCLIPAAAQTCIPGRVLAVDSVQGSLGDSSCRSLDRVRFASYHLDLPSRGTLRIDVDSAGFTALLRDSSGAKIAEGPAIRTSAEAGSYTIAVRAGSPGDTGSFALRTAFTAEPGMWCSLFASLGLEQTTVGRLGASGCVLPDGTPYESYRLRTFGSGTLTINVSSPSFAPWVVIRGSDGVAIASGTGTVSASVEADTEYQVAVLALDRQSGAYQIVTGFQPGDGETCRVRNTYSDPAQETGALADTVCNAAGALGEVTWFNYFHLSVSQPGVAEISAASDDFEPTLVLLDQSGNRLATDTGGGPVPVSSSLLRLNLAPGLYIVQVASSVPPNGNYEFAYQFTPGGTVSCASVSYSPGDSATGELVSGSCRTEIGLTATYAVTLPASGTLDVNVAPAGFAPVLALLDAKGNRLVLGNDAKGLGSAKLSADLPAGTYSLAVASELGTGTYQLSSSFAGHDLVACTNPQSIEANTGYVQRLGAGSCRGTDGQPVDYYQFTIPSDAVVASVMTSNELDGRLILSDGSGGLIRFDDDSYGFGDPLIVEYLAAGKYVLAARASTGSAGGLYRVDLLASPGPRPPFCAARGELVPGGSVSGSIGYAGCLYPDGTFADIYRLEVDADTAADLLLRSPSFDAALILLDASGSVVAADNDGGGGTDARITRSLPAGTYFVVTKPASDLTAGGTYTLSLTASPVQD